jgi:DNA-binding phage protein
MDARTVEFILYGNGSASTRWELRFNLRCAANVRLETSAARFEIVALDGTMERIVTRLMQVVDRSDGTTEVEASSHFTREHCYQHLATHPDVIGLRVTAEGQP